MSYFLKEISGINCQKCLAGRESMPVHDDIYVSDKLPEKDTRDQVVAATAPYGDLLKFLLLFGCLIFQGSQQAFAGTDFGLQSIPYFRDLSDFSTGILAYIFLRIGGEHLFHSSENYETQSVIEPFEMQLNEDESLDVN